LLLNRRTAPRQRDIRLDHVPRLPDSSGFTVRDVWAHDERKVAASEPQHVELTGHEAIVWRLTPAG
jgi:hypothetical protein